MPRPRTDIDRRLVHAARARFLVDGVDGASLRKIAADAKTSVGMVVYYFPTKDDLFLAVVDEVYAAFLHDLEEILRAPSSLAERLERVSIRVGRMSDHELDIVRLVAREALLSQTRFHQVFERFKRGHIPLLARALAEAALAGEVDAKVPMPVLIGCTFGAIAGSQLIRRAVESELPFAWPSPEETAAAATAVLFEGARAKGRPARRRSPRTKKTARRTR